MPVGISEIQTDSAAIPFHTALDFYPVRGQPSRPGVELSPLDTERKMRRSAAIVRRDRAAGRFESIDSRAALEEEKDVPARHVERNDSGVFDQRRKSESLLVEVGRASQIIGIQRSFQQLRDTRSSHTAITPSAGIS